MALSRELLKRLNSEDEPLPKRLKLAETVFYTMDIPFVRKEDLVLGWLCEICTTNQCAWKTVNNCLQSGYIDIKTNIKQCLVDKLMYILNNHTGYVYEYVLECFELILANNSMRQYFINKPKDLGLLIKAILDNITKRSNCHGVTQKDFHHLLEPCKLSSIENCIVANIIESLMQIYRQSITTKKELRLIFIHDILYPLCDIIDHKHIDSTNKLDIAAYKCIQQLLLGKSKCIWDKQTTDSNCIMLTDLFDTLSKNVRLLNLQSNISTYTFILRAAVGHYKSNTALLDMFFRNLINSSGGYKWEILNASLTVIHDVMLDFEHTIKNVTLSEYFQRLISDILKCDTITCAHYKILTQLSYINPLIIEKNIPNILDKVLMEEQTADYTNLLIAILHASTKMRREQKLVSQLLMSLKQHVIIRKTHRKTTFSFFPHEFRIRLAKSISNTQAIVCLRTLTYYLNTDCTEMLQHNTSCKNILMLEATIELLVVLFEGMQIFEYTRVLSAHEKLANVLDEIRNALSQLINKSLCLNHNTDVIAILLTGVQSLSEMQNMLKYYISRNAVTDKLTFAISDDAWQQLIQRISNFGEDNCRNIMNKLALHRIKLDTLDEPIKLRSLIAGLEGSWSTILRNDASILSLLNSGEISEVTYLLLTDMILDETNFRDWLKILDNEYIQENKCFTLCLLGHTLAQMGQCLSTGCTKSITRHINAKLLMEDESNGDNKLIQVLQAIKEQMLQQRWVQTKCTISCQIELYLEILLHMPIIYLSSNIRTLIFLIVYSISKECEKNDQVLVLCSRIFSDLVEKTGVDILQHTGSVLFASQLSSKNEIFSKVCKYSLRNVTKYATLKDLIERCAQCKRAMCIVLECMEVVNAKVNTEQKAIFRKAEKKLSKAILNVLPEQINDSLDARCLIVLVNIAISTGKISNDLGKRTKLTLQNVVSIKENSNSLLLQQNVQLAIIVLRHRKMFDIQETIIRNLWLVMLRHPCENLLKPLLTSTESKEFYEILKLLQNKTIGSLSQADDTTWRNMFIIWSDIMKTDMRIKCNKMRLAAVNNLFETVQLLHIPDAYWSNLLHLLRDIANAKHVLLPDSTINLIIMLGLKSLEKMNISSCENALALCGTLIKVRANLLTDSLPTLLLLYRNVVNIIVHASRNLDDKFSEHRFRCFAFDIEKITNLLVKLKKDMIRLSPYLIADLLQLLLEDTIPFYMKEALQNSLCQLISICDHHGIALLSRALSTPLQEMFKVQLDTFNKFHKYSGKV